MLTRESLFKNGGRRDGSISSDWNTRVSWTQKDCRCFNKLDPKANERGALESKTRSSNVQDATTTLPPVWVIAEVCWDGKTANSDSSPLWNAHLFSCIVPWITCSERRPRPSTVFIFGPLYFCKQKSEVAFTTILIGKILPIHGVIVGTMQKAVCLFDTGASSNLMLPSRVVTAWKQKNIRKDLRWLQIYMCQVLHHHVLVLLHQRLSQLHTRVRFGTDAHLAVGIFL